MNRDLQKRFDDKAIAQKAIRWAIFLCAFDWYDLAVLTVHDQGGHIEPPQVPGEVGL